MFPWPRHPRRLVFKERLVGSDFSCLSRTRLSLKFLQRLPAEPAEFVVVPHIDEGPSSARILDVGVMQVPSINRAIVFERCGDVKVADLFAVRITIDLAYFPVVHPLRAIFGIPGDFVDEVAEMQHETELICFCSALVFKNHSSIGVLSALGHVLATDERERYGPRIVTAWRGYRSADATAIAVFVREAVPIHSCWPQPANEPAAGPV